VELAARNYLFPQLGHEINKMAQRDEKSPADYRPRISTLDLFKSFKLWKRSKQKTTPINLSTQIPNPNSQFLSRHLENKKGTKKILCLFCFLG